MKYTHGINIIQPDNFNFFCMYILILSCNQHFKKKKEYKIASIIKIREVDTFD